MYIFYPSNTASLATSIPLQHKRSCYSGFQKEELITKHTFYPSNAVLPCTITHTIKGISPIAYACSLSLLTTIQKKKLQNHHRRLEIPKYNNTHPSKLPSRSTMTHTNKYTFSSAHAHESYTIETTKQEQFLETTLKNLKSPIQLHVPRGTALVFRVKSHQQHVSSAIYAQIRLHFRCLKINEP